MSLYDIVKKDQVMSFLHLKTCLLNKSRFREALCSHTQNICQVIKIVIQSSIKYDGKDFIFL